MIDTPYALAGIAAMAAVTFGLRALPFLAARWLNAHPFVQRLGQFLPLAMMTLLLIHAAVGAATEHTAGPWPEVAAVAASVLLQWYARHPLFSMLVGTGLYVWWRNGGL